MAQPNGHQQPWPQQQQQQQQYQQRKERVIQEFRVMMSNLFQMDGDQALRFSQFASLYHDVAAKEITFVIKDFITQKQDRQYEYIYVMDHIIKHVQGAYIRHFAQQLKYVIGLVMQRAANSREDQKKLVKMFKTWEELGFFDSHLLNEISTSLNMHSLEEQLLTQDDLQKISHWKENLNPGNLPQQLVVSGEYICGTQVNKRQIWQKHQENQRLHGLQYGGPPQGQWPNQQMNGHPQFAQINQQHQQQQVQHQQPPFQQQAQPQQQQQQNYPRQPQQQRRPEAAAAAPQIDDLLTQLQFLSQGGANAAAAGFNQAASEDAPAANAAPNAVVAPATANATMTDEREKQNGPVGPVRPQQVAPTPAVATPATIQQVSSIDNNSREQFGGVGGASGRQPQQQPSAQVIAGGAPQVTAHANPTPSQAPAAAAELAATAGSMMNQGSEGPATGMNPNDWRGNQAAAQQQQQFASPLNGANHSQSVAQQAAMHAAAGHHAGFNNRHHAQQQPNLHPPAQQPNQQRTAIMAGGVRSTTSHLIQSNQKSVGFRQFGFLPSLLKSFTSFNKTQQLSLGNFIFHQATPQANSQQHGGQQHQHAQQHQLCPSFSNLESLKQKSQVAQVEIFQGIKFQCSICGMRFVRNLALKEHLNAHFEANLALKRRGDRTMARDQFQGFAEFVAPRKHIIKQDGEAAGGTNGPNKKDMVPYDGRKSHIATYNLCYLCKERLDTCHDDQDEGWYFIDTRRVRFLAKAATADSAAKPSSVVNVHTNCLKEIEEMNFSKDSIIEVPVVGQKRTYVDAQEESKNDGVSGGQQQIKTADNSDIKLRGLQDIIKGLESQKKRRKTTASE